MEKVDDYMNPEVLRKLYWDEYLSVDQVAERLYVSRDTVMHWMKKLGIERRPPHPRYKGTINYRNRKVLRELVVDRGLTPEQIARKSGCKPTTIRKWIRKYEIPCRFEGRGFPKYYDVGGGKMMNVRQIAEAAGVSQPTISGRIARGWRPEDLLTPNLYGTKFTRGRKAAKLKRETGGYR